VLAAMAPSHERGLGEWQAELAEWPSLFLEAHGALAALADACDGLEVDTARMRENIERQHGAVFAEAAAALLVPSLGKAKAHALLASLSSRTRIRWKTWIRASMPLSRVLVSVATCAR